MNSGNNKTKVIMVANKLDVTGISTVIMNYCSNLDLSKFDVEIAAGYPISEIHKNVCQCLEIKLHELPNRKQNSKRYYKELNQILRSGNYDILHVHGNSATMAVELFLAWIHGVKVRIPHSHNTTCTSMKLHKILRPMFDCLYTQAFACGQKAGEWLYGSKLFYIIPNGFNTEKYKFSQQARDKIRGQLKLENFFVIGHIGRFNEQKNQPFLIDVFEEYAKTHSNAVLLLVGIGPDYEKTKRLAEQSLYKDRIIFYGETDASQELYSAMDVFVLPSRYEGMPVVLVEAECSGLYCIISDKVTNEMNIDNHIVSLSLDEPVKKWCEIIEKVPMMDRERFFDENCTAISQYNITTNAKRLEKLYADFVK